MTSFRIWIEIKVFETSFLNNIIIESRASALNPELFRLSPKTIFSTGYGKMKYTSRKQKESEPVQNLAKISVSHGSVHGSVR